MFDFIDNDHSVIAGMSSIFALNAVLISVMLTGYYISNLVLTNSISMGLSFFLLYLFNLNVFGKQLYVIIGSLMAKATVYKMDIGALFTCLVMTIIVGWISIEKFSLIPLNDQNSFIIMFIMIFSALSLSSIGLTKSTTGVSDAALTSDKSEVDGYRCFIDRKKLRILNISFLIIPFMINAMVLYFIL